MDRRCCITPHLPTKFRLQRRILHLEQMSMRATVRDNHRWGLQELPGANRSKNCLSPKGPNSTRTAELRVRDGRLKHAGFFSRVTEKREPAFWDWKAPFGKLCNRHAIHIGIQGFFVEKLSLPRVLSVCIFEGIARIQQVIGGIARMVTVPCRVAHESGFEYG